MENLFLTNYTEKTFLDKIRENLRRCTAFYFSVSFIKRVGLVLLLYKCRGVYRYEDSKRELS